MRKGYFVSKNYIVPKLTSIRQTYFATKTSPRNPFCKGTFGHTPERNLSGVNCVISNLHRDVNSRNTGWQPTLLLKNGNISATFANLVAQ